VFCSFLYFQKKTCFTHSTKYMMLQKITVKATHIFQGVSVCFH
jgi:hypothetical protein